MITFNHKGERERGREGGGQEFGSRDPGSGGRILNWERLSHTGIYIFEGNMSFFQAYIIFLLNHQFSSEICIYQEITDKL